MAVEAGADAVGFVFYDKSPRFVTAERVRGIVKELPGRVETVGVFLNEEPERLAQVADWTYRRRPGWPCCRPRQASPPQTTPVSVRGDG